MSPGAKGRWGIGALLLLGIVLVAAVHFEPGEWVESLVRSASDPIRFMALMALLPAIGAPIGPFLVGAGAMFGTGPGLALALLAMPIHLAAAILAARAVREPLMNFLERRGIRIPSVDARRQGLYSIVFFAAPGLPYVLKNVLPPLAGFRFRHCFFTNWLVQGLHCLPLVFLGASAAKGRFGMAAGMAAVLLILVFFGRHLRRRYGNGAIGRNGPDGKNSPETDG